MLTANDIALVRTSFAKVLPIKDVAADLFYDRLFEIAPQLRGMFPQDLEDQKTKLMTMLAAAIGGLHDLNTLVPHVKALGARHASYGVTVAHYAIVADALMSTLERSLGDAFTPDVRSAWAKVYGVLAGTMQTGAVEAAGTRAA
jgi:hemoglobin-like flavoprotein